MTLRVVLLGPYPRDGRTPSGGVEAVSMYLAGGLRELKSLDLHVLTCDVGVSRRTVRSKQGISVRSLPSSRRLRRITWYAMERREIRRELQRLGPDVVHVQGTDMYGVAGLRSGFPSVVTVHGIAQNEARITNPATSVRGQLHHRLRRVGNSIFEKATLRSAEDVIVISPYVECSIESMTRARTHFIPNPIGDGFFDVAGREVEGRVLFVGRLDPKKRVQDLLRAINRVRRSGWRVELRIVGPAWDKSYQRMLTEYVKTERLGSHVKFLGWVSQEVLLREYELCSMVVLCSEEESSPLAIQQAMAAGKPAVASRAAGVPWLVEDRVTGLLFDAGDDQEMANSILRLLKDPLRRAKMGEAARARALEQFSAGSVADRTRNVYHQVLADQAKS